MTLSRQRISFLILLASYFIRVFGSSQRSLWYDETASISFSGGTAWQIADKLLRNDANTPLFYFVLRIWTSLVGTSEFASRSLPIFAGVITVAFAAQLVRSSPRRSPLATHLAMLGVALWPVCIYISTELRPYSMLIALTTAATAILLRALNQPAIKSLWVAWASLIALAFAVHIVALLAFLAHAVLIVGLFTTRKFRHTFPMLLTSALGALLALAMFAILSSSKRIGADHRLEFTPVLLDVLANNLLPRSTPNSLMQLAAIVNVVLLGLLLIRVPRLAIVTATYIILIAAAGAVTATVAGRLHVLFSPLLAAGMGILCALAPVYVRIPTLMVWIGLSAVGIVAWHTSPLYANDDFKSAVPYVYSHLQADEAVIVLDGEIDDAIHYYRPEAPLIGVKGGSNGRLQADFGSVAATLNQGLAGRGGAWVIRWGDLAVDPGGTTLALLRRQSHELRSEDNVPGFAGVKVDHFRFDNPFEQIPEAIPKMVSSIEPFGADRGIKSMGCTQYRRAYAGQSRLELACFWQGQTNEYLPWDVQVSLRLQSKSGMVVAQQDQNLAPISGLPVYPSPYFFPAFYYLPINDVRAGKYDIVVLPYLSTGPVWPRLTTEVEILE